MRQIIASTLCALAILLLAVPPGTAQQAVQQPVVEPLAALPDWVYDGSAELPEVPEPSALCYCPERDTLFIVDDGGPERLPAVFELDLHATVLAKLELGRDLEGICYCTEDGLLYVADEAAELIYVVNPEGLALIGHVAFSTDFGGERLLTEGGNGIEGIEYIPGMAGGHFLLLNQDDPHALLRISYEAVQEALGSGEVAPIEAWWQLPQINAGELYFDAAASELWVVHSWMNVMEILDVPTMALKRWEVIPGAAQEGVTLDGQGRLWIASDLGTIDRYLRPADAAAEATE